MENTKSSPGEKPRIVLYCRPGCHLCDEVKKVIQASGFNEEYTLEEINIESDPDLLERYRYDIPVITINGVEAFRHQLTLDEFRKRLKEAARSAVSQ
jgi:glutaredoxin